MSPRIANPIKNKEELHHLRLDRFRRRRLSAAICAATLITLATAGCSSTGNQQTTSSPSGSASSTVALGVASSPSPVNTMPSVSESSYYPGQGSINVTRMLPGDRTYVVQDAGQTITLPEVRPVTASSTPQQLADSANSVLTQLSYYLKTNDEAVAQQVLSHLVTDPSTQVNLVHQRQIDQSYREQHGVPVEVATFEDSSNDPAVFALQDKDDGGNPIVALARGDLESANFTGFKVTDQNGNLQNKQKITKFWFAVSPDGKISSYELDFAG